MAVVNDRISHARHRVEATAGPAFASWISEQPDESLKGFGFLSRAEAKLARVLTPLPYVTPRRARLTRKQIEGGLDQPPATWIVPVSVNSRVVCLVTVEDANGKTRAVEYGKAWAANRLDAGIRALGSPPPERWSELRFVSFASPNVDLLLFRNTDSRWSWWRLEGTESATTTRFTPHDIDMLLENIRRTPKEDPLSHQP